MASVQDRVRDARQKVMADAFARWVEHWRIREEKRALVAQKGPGAADSPQHRDAFRKREAVRAASDIARAAERMIGGSWEGVFFAPSERARAAASPVARIVEWGGDGYQPVGVGTGFLVSPDLLLTNWHVIPEPSCATDLYANFGHERTERGTAAGTLFALDPGRCFYAHEGFDFALIAVSRAGTGAARLDELGTIPLIGSVGKIRTGDPMHVIQHPGGGPRQYAVTNNRLVDILELEGFLHYESDTLRGSSGSPVFNQHWELVALHHSGVPAMRGADVMRRDGTPWDPQSDDEDDIDWVANEGARVSFIVRALRAARLDTAEAQGLVDQLLASVDDPLATPSGAAPPPVVAPEVLPERSAGSPSLPPRGSAMTANIFNISGGTVTIHVAAGAAPAERAADVTALISAPAAAPAVAFVEKAQNFDPDYTARPGYDPKFLGVEIPLPTIDPRHHADLYTVGHYRRFADEVRNVPELDVAARGDGDALVLPYHHYSLVMNAKLRMAMFTASNADYSDEARQDPRNREAFGGESWRLDPRVPKEIQLVNADIYGPARNLDRGHLVRREDSAWGAPGLDTEFANADSYHWTNCTPQHELFNQETPKGAEYKGRSGIWGAFEGALQAELLKGGGQATIFAGPVLYSDTEVEDFGRGPVVYPRKFWKVIVVPTSRGRRPDLAAYGFVFDQTDALKEFGLGVERLDLGKFNRQVMPLRQVQELSGVIFPEIVLTADQQGKQDAAPGGA
jgi:endonuclease G